MSLLLLAACGTGIFSSERDRSPATGEVVWSGYLFRSPDVADENVLSNDLELDGESDCVDEECPVSVAIMLPDGTLVEATEPYPDYPGYWSATLPANSAFSLRISGEALLPAVWDGATGDRDASWFSGAVFGLEAAWFTEYLATLGDPGSYDEAAVTVWGYPADPDTWRCPEIRVAETTPTCYLTDEDGITTLTEEGPVTTFLAFELPAGAVTIDSGDGASYTYTTTPGDVVLAFWFIGFAP